MSEVHTPTRRARRPDAVGYARGVETRQRIVLAAMKLFGRDGYEGTSTRDIAACAEVNAPVLQYYFDGKEGLYSACAEYMSSRIRDTLQPVLDTVGARLSKKISRAGLIDCVCLIYERTAEFMLLNPELECWMRFITWNDRDEVPPRARKLIDEGIGNDMRAALREVIGRIIGKDPDDAETRIRVLTLGGQLSVFNVARQYSLEFLGWKAVDQKALRQLNAIIREQTAAALRSAG
jgi:TetR/AcrR family transcriptional regulator, regulator of cefoperazone and chloramphenicol sensitivity